MSADLMRKIETARAQVDVAWTDERAQVVGRQMMRRKRRRDTVRGASLVVASLVVLLVVGFGVRRYMLPGAAPNVASAPLQTDAPAVLKLADGSVVTPVDRNSLVRTAQTSATRVVVEVVSGAAKFDVTPNSGRVFRVEAGRVAVEVLGTSFTVERLAQDSAKVSVQRGRVRVSWDDEAVELGAGEEGLFPRQRAQLPATSASSQPVESAAPTAPPAPPAPPAISARPAWRALHQEGDFDKAWEVLQREGIDKVRDDAGELLAAADVARMSKHSAQAVGPLRRLLASHPGDPRAPLAAFTLGRVLLDELGRPREAADAFAQARKGAMAEDALAREVEAWSRAGDATTARARAEEYLKLYPSGRRERSVRRYGGLE
ncbi:MAG: FecR domain-containing protein [Deltaproteobacteria bacterium]|nr:FecR domain-containing protein [Deltaproteobacteria bacterium]